MKIIIIPVLSVLLAVAFSEADSNATESSQLSGKMFKRMSYSDINLQKALVYLMKKKEFLCGGALLSTKYILSSSYCLREFLETKSLISDLFAGIGTDKFCKKCNAYHHYVTDVKDNKDEDPGIYSRIAIVTIVEIPGKIPKHVKPIPLSGYIHPDGSVRVSGVSFGWNQNLEVRKDSITQIDVVDNIIFARIRIYSKGERYWDQKNYIGGFLTHKGSLAGIAFNFQYFSSDTNSIKLLFVQVDGNSDFIYEATYGEIGIKDIKVGRNGNGASSFFSCATGV